MSVAGLAASTSILTTPPVVAPPAPVAANAAAAPRDFASLVSRSTSTVAGKESAEPRSGADDGDETMADAGTDGRDDDILSDARTVDIGTSPQATTTTADATQSTEALAAAMQQGVSAVLALIQTQATTAAPPTVSSTLPAIPTLARPAAVATAAAMTAPGGDAIIVAAAAGESTADPVIASNGAARDMPSDGDLAAPVPQPVAVPQSPAGGRDVASLLAALKSSFMASASPLGNAVARTDMPVDATPTIDIAATAMPSPVAATPPAIATPVDPTITATLSTPVASATNTATTPTIVAIDPAMPIAMTTPMISPSIDSAPAAVKIAGAAPDVPAPIPAKAADIPPMTTADGTAPAAAPTTDASSAYAATDADPIQPATAPDGILLATAGSTASAPFIVSTADRDPSAPTAVPDDLPSPATTDKPAAVTPRVPVAPQAQPDITAANPPSPVPATGRTEAATRAAGAPMVGRTKRSAAHDDQPLSATTSAASDRIDPGPFVAGTSQTMATAPSDRSDGIAAATAQPQASEQAVTRHLDLAHETQWMDQLAKDISQAAVTNGHLKFQLNPEHLGSLAIEVQNSAAGTSIRMTAETDHARTIIADAQPRLIAEVRAQGLRVAESHVDLGNQNASGSAAGQQQRQSPSEDHKPFARTQAVTRDESADSRTPADDERYA